MDHEITLEFREILTELNDNQCYTLLDKIVSFVVDNGLNEHILCPEMNKIVMKKRWKYYDKNTRNENNIQGWGIY